MYAFNPNTHVGGSTKPPPNQEHHGIIGSYDSSNNNNNFSSHFLSNNTTIPTAQGFQTAGRSADQDRDYAAATYLTSQIPANPIKKPTPKFRVDGYLMFEIDPTGRHVFKCFKKKESKSLMNRKTGGTKKVAKSTIQTEMQPQDIQLIQPTFSSTSTGSYFEVFGTPLEGITSTPSPVTTIGDSKALGEFLKTREYKKKNLRSFKDRSKMVSIVPTPIAVNVPELSADRTARAWVQGLFEQQRLETLVVGLDSYFSQNLKHRIVNVLFENHKDRDYVMGALGGKVWDLFPKGSHAKGEFEFRVVATEIVPPNKHFTVNSADLDPPTAK